MDQVIEPNLGELIIVSYDGEVDEATGRYHGNGAATLDNNSSYEGSFHNGLFHGKGRFVWSDTTTFEGNFSNGMISGKGMYKWPDGSTYDGEVLSGKRHGSGIFKCSGNQVFDGSWKHGLRHGKGKMNYNENNTVTYTGEWGSGLRDGFGTMRYSNGSTYEGYWKADKKNGRGIMIWRDVDEIYTGDWRNNLPDGTGEYIWSETGGSGSANGNSNNNNSSAPAASQGKSGLRQMCNLYRGEFKQGLRHGNGTFFYGNGSQYSGQWQSNQKYGEGVHVFSDGRIYSGIFYKDRIDEAAMQSCSHLISGILNPKISDDVSPQYRLNIDDIITRFKVLMQAPMNLEKEGNVPNFLLLEHQTVEVERLLLRYNSYLKMSYRRLSDVANRRRQRERVDVSTSDKYAAKWSPIEQTMITTRNIYKRLFCITISQLKRFLREMEIIDEVHLNSWDISVLIDHMKCHHQQVAISRQFEYRKIIFGDNAEPSEMQEKFLFAEDKGAARIGHIMDNIYGPRTASTSNQSPLPGVYSDQRYPILDREFIELFVRSIAEQQLRMISLSEPSKKPSSNKTLSLYIVVNKVCAEKLQPILNDPSLINDFVQGFYNDGVQDMIRSDQNMSKLQKVWRSIAKVSTEINTTGIEAEVTSDVKSLIKLLTSSAWKGSATQSDATVMDYIRVIFGEDVCARKDLSIINKKIDFDDFVYLFFKIIASSIWTFDEESQISELKAPDTMSDELQTPTEEVKQSEIIPAKPIHEILQGRLLLWFLKFK